MKNFNTFPSEFLKHIHTYLYNLIQSLYLKKHV